MKIAQVLTIRLHNASGGTQKVYADMANAMARSGHEVGCFYYDEKKGAPFYSINEAVHLTNAFSKARKTLANIRSCLILNKKKRRAKRRITSISYVINDLKAFKPDIILLYWLDPIINDLVKLKIPVVMMMHMLPSYFAACRCFPACKESLAKCDCIQVLMPDTIDEMKQLVNNDNIVCIPNVVPQYDTISNTDSRTIVFVGRKSAEKRPWLLVQAFALLKDKYPDWKVEMWGEEHFVPHITKRVKALITEHSLEKQVLMYGPTHDIEKVLDNASIFVLPSSQESFGMALTEAMSKGVPSIVCSDCTSCATLVRHGENGLHCEPTAEDMALQLSKLMDSQELRTKLGKQAHEDVKIFSPDVVFKQWERLMTSLILD